MSGVRARQRSSCRLVLHALSSCICPSLHDAAAAARRSIDRLSSEGRTAARRWSISSPCSRRIAHRHQQPHALPHDAAPDTLGSMAARGTNERTKKKGKRKKEKPQRWVRGAQIGKTEALQTSHTNYSNASQAQIKYKTQTQTFVNHQLAPKTNM